MDEKKTNELTDEALDAVTGGVSCQYNETTGQFDVVKNGECVASCLTEKEAQGIAASYTSAETPRFQIFDPSNPFRR